MKFDYSVFKSFLSRGCLNQYITYLYFYPTTTFIDQWRRYSEVFWKFFKTDITVSVDQRLIAFLTCRSLPSVISDVLFDDLESECWLA